MLRVREANKAIKSNQKFRSLTPELTAEATNTLINICGAVNDGLSESSSSPCCATEPLYQPSVTLNTSKSCIEWMISLYSDARVALALLCFRIILHLSACCLLSLVQLSACWWSRVRHLAHDNLATWTGKPVLAAAPHFQTKFQGEAGNSKERLEIPRRKLDHWGMVMFRCSNKETNRRERPDCSSMQEKVALQTTSLESVPCLTCTNHLCSVICTVCFSVWSSDFGWWTTVSTSPSISCTRTLSASCRNEKKKKRKTKNGEILCIKSCRWWETLFRTQREKPNTKI